METSGVSGHDFRKLLSSLPSKLEIDDAGDKLFLPGNAPAAVDLQKRPYCRAYLSPQIFVCN